MYMALSLSKEAGVEEVEHEAWKRRVSGQTQGLGISRQLASQWLDPSGNHRCLMHRRCGNPVKHKTKNVPDVGVGAL